ncbi:hypothetical protein PENTCL1PPCAC_5176, partial [Pristionchus entomophagus]
KSIYFNSNVDAVVDIFSHKIMDFKTTSEDEIVAFFRDATTEHFQIKVQMENAPLRMLGTVLKTITVQELVIYL